MGKVPIRVISMVFLMAVLLVQKQPSFLLMMKTTSLNGNNNNDNFIQGNIVSQIRRNTIIIDSAVVEDDATTTNVNNNNNNKSSTDGDQKVVMSAAAARIKKAFDEARQEQKKEQELKELQQKEQQQQQQRSPRKLYIDLGANCGNSYYRAKLNMAPASRETLSTPDWEAYLWECNPQLIDWFLKDLIEKEENVYLIQKAASTSNGYATFFLTAGQESATSKEQLPNPTCDPRSPYQPGGASTLYGQARRAGKNITVETIDFLQWHKDLQLQPGDIVHMKMDIEGAEVDIIETFLKDDTNQICYWEIFWNEYHKLIFQSDTDEYKRHEQFELTFPTRFEEKCGKKLIPNKPARL